MATIKRAHSYLTYILAIATVGFFSIFGRSGPSWAEEVKSDRKAEAFHEVFQVADSTVYSTSATAQDTRGKAVNIAFDGRYVGLDSLTPEREVSVHRQLSTTLQNIDLKLQKDQELTPGELAFLNSISLNGQIEDLKEQIRILSKTR